MIINKELLQSFVPMNRLSTNFLDQLSKNQTIKVACRDQHLFEMGDVDNATLYLLSGDVELIGPGVERRIISAGGLDSWHPIDHWQPRKTTCRALNDVSYVKIDTFRLDTLLSWDQSSGYMILDIASDKGFDGDAEWMVELLHSNLFFKVPPANIQKIFQVLESMPVKAGDHIINQGDEGDYCYFIKSGVASVVKEHEKQKPLIVAELKLGQYFGEEALLSGAARNANVVMKTDGVLMRLAKADFETLLKLPIVDEISFTQALKQVENGAQWLDVRLEEEYETGHLPGPNMPLNLLRLKSRLLEKNKMYIVCCTTGRRSAAATYLLSDEGFEVKMLAGGLDSLKATQREDYFTQDSDQYILRDNVEKNVEKNVGKNVEK